MRDAARAWLRERSGNVPPALETRMERAIDDAQAAGKAGPRDHTAQAIHDVLSDAARICLAEALEHIDSRTAALHLLAADALITYACEAATDAGAEALRRIAEDWSSDRLMHVLTANGAM